MEKDGRHRINVLHLVGSFHQGGSELQAVQLARLQHEDGRCRVHLACFERGGVLLDAVGGAGRGGIEQYPMTSFYSPGALRQVVRFARHLRANDIAVVQTHDFYTNVFGMAGAALARVPVRVAARRETAGFRSPAQLRVERRAYGLAHAVVANAEAVKARLVGEGVPAAKVTVVYNGLDMGRVNAGAGVPRAEALAALGLPADAGRRYVTIVANLRHPVKDHPTFLRAAQQIRAAVPEAAFVLAGEGELTEPMRALAAELGISRETFFIGRCGRVGELLAVSDVCVLSSKAEGFSNSILEYMAAARPVVATDVGGAREAVVEGETGHLVRPGDDVALAARVISLLRDPGRARAMGGRGRKVVEERFSSGAQLERTLGLYERLLTKAQPGAARLVESVRREGA